MTELELGRKAALCCPDCGAPSSETSVRCERHRQAAARRQVAYIARIRSGRRQLQRCADCAVPSTGYRCQGCRARAKERLAGASTSCAG